MSSGCFGENLTTTGIDIGAAVVGERWAVGRAVVLEVSDPRIPCRTFAGFLGEQNWIRRFTERAQPGTYLRVIRPGEVAPGDPITVVSRPDHTVTVATAFRALTTRPDLLPALVGVDGLSPEAKRTVSRRAPAVKLPAVKFG